MQKKNTRKKKTLEIWEKKITFSSKQNEGVSYGARDTRYGRGGAPILIPQPAFAPGGRACGSYLVSSRNAAFGANYLNRNGVKKMTDRCESRSFDFTLRAKLRSELAWALET